MLGIVTSSINAKEIFNDSFESADMSATNSDGFKWDKNNRTSVVIQDPSDGPVSLYMNKVTYDIYSSVMPDKSVRDWSAKDKTYALRFRYPAGQKWSEQRYDLGGAYPDVWVSYWIRVPNNYYRGSGRNNKWFNIQMAPMDQYSDKTVSRVEMQDWSNRAGGVKINIQFRNGSGGYTNSSSYNNFITPADAGRWMHVIYHLKASATASSTDGLIRMYRRWKNEADYTLINELTNLNVGIGAGSVSAGRLGWAAGYIMGYSNTSYANDTEWLLDSFVVSDTPLLTTQAEPKAPASLVTQ